MSGGCNSTVHVWLSGSSYCKQKSACVCLVPFLKHHYKYIYSCVCFFLKYRSASPQEWAGQALLSQGRQHPASLCQHTYLFWSHSFFRCFHWSKDLDEMFLFFQVDIPGFHLAYVLWTTGPVCDCYHNCWASALLPLTSCLHQDFITAGTQF